MAVLTDYFQASNKLVDGEDSCSAKFGTIKYYKDEDILSWGKNLKLNNTYGIRTFWDLQQNQEKQSNEEWQ